MVKEKEVQLKCRPPHWIEVNVDLQPPPKYPHKETPDT
jgi:hypothetical protein